MAQMATVSNLVLGRLRYQMLLFNEDVDASRQRRAPKHEELQPLFPTKSNTGA